MSSHHPAIDQTSKGVVLTIHVQPNAKRTEFVGLHGDALKVRVASPPVDGAANDTLCRFLAERFSVPLSRIVIQSGGGSRRKRVLLESITVQQAAQSFDLSLGKEHA